MKSPTPSHSWRVHVTSFITGVVLPVDGGYLAR
jgi:hypothetical protein